MPRAPSPAGWKTPLLFATVVAIIGGIWWSKSPPPDPVYKGLRLSTWLFHRSIPFLGAADNVQIQDYGPAAIPWLTYTLEHGRLPPVPHGPRILNYAPEWLRERTPETWGGDIAAPEEGDRVPAARALQELGPAAASAIPALVRSMESEQSERYALGTEAAWALCAIGPASAPALQSVLEHGSPKARHDAISVISGWNGWNKYPASDTCIMQIFRTVLKSCRDPDREMRVRAPKAVVECYLRLKNDIFLDPTLNELFRLLSEQDRTVRLSALSELGTMIAVLNTPAWNRRPAAPLSEADLDRVKKLSADRVSTLLDDPDPDCREAAAKALAACTQPSVR